MNTATVLEHIVPFNLFYLWRIDRLQAFDFMLIRLRKDGDTFQNSYVWRVNRSHVKNLSSGKSRKEDCGLHHNQQVVNSRKYPLNLIQASLESDTTVMQYRITVATSHADTLYWEERTTEREAESIPLHPSHIVYTNYGWQLFSVFLASPHMKLYVIIGGNYTDMYASNANFFNVDRAQLQFGSAGWYDASQIRDLGNGVYVTKSSCIETSDGRTRHLRDYSLQFSDESLASVRTAFRRLVRIVKRGELTSNEARDALYGILTDADVVEHAHRSRALSFQSAWRGLYMKNHRLIANEDARIIRELMWGIHLHSSTGRVSNCSTCSATISSWQSYETAIVEGEEDEIDRTSFYCSLEHAQQDRRLFTTTPLPRKYAYTENVLTHMAMGQSHALAPKGELIRVGVELETYHATLPTAIIPAQVVGGSITKKLGTSRSQKVKWDIRNYRKWGAIPVHDGSLDSTKGVEWVFRPSDLVGMQHDLRNFMTATRGLIEYDADTADYVETDNSHTYGLHTHVTATDAMKGVAARFRMTLVGSMLAPIIHAIGDRAYSHYTRLYAPDSGRILNMNRIAEHRAKLRARANRVPAWARYIQPPIGQDVEYFQQLVVSDHSVGESPRRRGTSEGVPYYHAITDRNLFVKYNMVNVLYNKPTIEMRHGRSFVNENNIMLNAELSQAVVLFATYEIMSYRQCIYERMPSQFAEYVWDRRKTYPRLARWLMQQAHKLREAFVVPTGQRTLARYGSRV